MILPGRASQALAAALARETDRSLGEVITDRFPDGELLVEVPSELPDRAVIVASTTSDAAFVESLLIQDAVREAGVTEVTTVIPYLGYARQDEAFEPGQPVSIRPLARAIGTGTDRVITVNPHERSVLDHFPTETTAVSAAARLVDPLPARLSDPLFLAPDAGAIGLAETVQAAYGTGRVDHLEKVRRSGSTVEISLDGVACADRDVVLVDDIIATGGTMSEAIAVLRANDAARIFVACVHPLLTASARTRLAKAGVARVIGTDTIERPESVVSAARPIAEAFDD